MFDNGAIARKLLFCWWFSPRPGKAMRDGSRTHCSSRRFRTPSRAVSSIASGTTAARRLIHAHAAPERISPACSSPAC